jgi:predicted outer membrane protein
LKRLLIALWIGVLGALLLGTVPAAAEDGAEPPATQPGDSPAPARFSYNGPVGGELAETDKVFLQKVRQAGMWERPAGQDAQRKGGSARTREVGKLIDFDHANLDADVIGIAERLNVDLPNRPTPEQQMWLDELAAKSGKPFDDAFANLLRNAHGAVFQLIANIRANSRNDLVRAFASHANNVVHRHMVLLESTGDVNYDHLPKAKASTGRTRPYQQEPLFVVALIAVAGAVGFTGVMRAIRA